MNTVPHPKRFVQAAVCDSRVIRQPLPRCEVLPDGLPGVLEINGTVYAVEILGYLPAEGPLVLDGYRLTKTNGEAHDVCLVAGRLECTCGDWLWRRSYQTDRQLADCKHCLACRKHFAAPADQQPEAAPVAVPALELEDL